MIGLDWMQQQVRKEWYLWEVRGDQEYSQSVIGVMLLDIPLSLPTYIRRVLLFTPLF